MEKVESFKCRILTWDEIARWTEAVAYDIADNGFRPTVVIGLTRGGWVSPGDLRPPAGEEALRG